MKIQNTQLDTPQTQNQCLKKDGMNQTQRAALHSLLYANFLLRKIRRTGFKNHTTHTFHTRSSGLLSIQVNNRKDKYQSRPKLKKVGKLHRVRE